MAPRELWFRRGWLFISLLLVLTLLLGSCSNPFDGDDDDMADATQPLEITQSPAGTEPPATAAEAGAETSPTDPDGEAQPPPAAAQSLDLSATPDGRFGFGDEPSEDVIAALDIDVAPSGQGPPEGSGTAIEGEEVFNAKCAHCHGDEGQGNGIGPQLVADSEVWEPGEPRTVNNYWPYTTTIFDYVNRAMPFDNPNSLEPDEVYAVVAYLLYLGGIIGEDEEMNAETLPQVEMPNRENFSILCWPDHCLPETQ